MIIYKRSAAEFLSDVDNNLTVDVIKSSFVQGIGWYPEREVASWTNSMPFMATIVRNSKLSSDCGIFIEYRIPLSSRRIDFVISGTDETGNRNFVIVEVKQWGSAEATKSDGVVVTFLAGGKRETTHPSYQANTYKALLVDYNENIEKKNLNPFSCAYLHNYSEKKPEPLHADIYNEIVTDTPLFFKHDAGKLQKFICKHVGRGKGMVILYDIQFGNIRPSKKLIDHVCSMFKGNKVFTLIDNQKVAFEKALDIARKADKKTILIIKGGPGTGKSVISINLLGALLNEQQNTVFVAPNASFREVMLNRLAQENRRNRLNHLFKGSSSFVDVEPNTFDTVVVDEAHRLKNGTAYQYQGENQLEDIIKSSMTTILFIDDDQRIRPEDIGTVEEIKRVARAANAKIHEIELEAQFRCAGADGFINWVDHLLQIRETANFDGWDKSDFEFKIFDDPNQMRNAIRIRNNEGFASRMLAGYAWAWTSEKKGNADGEIEDVTIPAHKFSMPWNSRKSRTTWAIDPDGVDQVGCIHTSQGLEFDYVGVIVGNDLRFDPASGRYLVDWKSYKDAAGKKSLKNRPEELSKLVRNIYRTLMTRALKGCYVYFCDKNVEAHFKESFENMTRIAEAESKRDIDTLLSQIEFNIAENLRYTEFLPLYSFAAACGYFGEGKPAEVEGWIRAKAIGKLRPNMFVVKAQGRSMEPMIKDGTCCVFKAPVAGTRQSKIVLVQHHNAYDPDYGGAYSIKKYTSKKAFNEDGTWQHEEITLVPLNSEYAPITIKEEDGESVIVVAEFVGCI